MINLEQKALSNIKNEGDKVLLSNIINNAKKNKSFDFAVLEFKQSKSSFHRFLKSQLNITYNDLISFFKIQKTFKI